MPEVEVRIPNLVPGKRYRMIVETTSESVVGPSIEFTVPSSPRLISTYTPKYKRDVVTYVVPGRKWDITVVGQNWSRPASTATSIADRMIIQNEGDVYVFRIISGQPLPPDDQLFTILGASERITTKVNTEPFYYDWLDYTVTKISSRLVNARGKPNPTKKKDGVGTHVGWGKAPWNAKKTVGGVAYRSTTHWDDAKFNGKGFDAETKNKTITLSWRVPGASGRTADQYGWVPDNKTVTQVNIKVSVPEELQAPNVLINSDNIKHIPVFFYIKGGVFYNVDDNTVMGTTPRAIPASAMPSTIPMSQTNLDVGADVRDYRFTIATYTKQGSSWVGEWQQVADTYESVGPSMSRVIYSKSAVL
jgi:hypothetical protein